MSGYIGDTCNTQKDYKGIRAQNSVYITEPTATLIKVNSTSTPVPGQRGVVYTWGKYSRVTLLYEKNRTVHILQNFLVIY